MLGKLANFWPVRRVGALAVGFWDTFLRDNKVIPPVLAVIALFVFSWIVVGSFIGTPGDEPVASQNEVAQSDGGGNGSQAPAPEVENPNTDSYAAYQSKDPFRQLFQTAESTTQETTDDGTGDDGTGDGSGGNGGGFQDDDSSNDGTSDDGTSDDGTSTGNPGGGAADDQYANGRTPRDDPTDDADGTTDDTGTRTPQTPTQPNRPADTGDDLFDSGGNLAAPNRR